MTHRRRNRTGPLSVPVAAALIAFLLSFAPPARAGGPFVPAGFVDEPVVTGLDHPVGLAPLPDGRMFVIELNSGRIRLIVADTLAAPNPVGTVNGLTTHGERGLLGIAVDPGWPARPYLYVHSTHSGGNVWLSRYTVTGDLSFTGSGGLSVDASSRFNILTDIPDDAGNHNGGTARFGPDGMLYVSLGEDATRCAAQDTSTLRGVILRLDVSALPAGPGGPPAKSLITPPDNPFSTTGSANARLTWAWGFRNPFRFQIDPADGVLYVGDVGEGTWEEIDRAAFGGIDFGWPLREGPVSFSGAGGCVASRAPTNPIYAYDRTNQDAGAAVIAAGVYRARAGAPYNFPAEYEGSFFLIDYYTGSMTRLVGGGDAWSVAPAVPGQPTVGHWAEGIFETSDFARGHDGALWYCRQAVAGDDGTGEIRRIRPGVAIVDTVGKVVDFERVFPLPAKDVANLVFTLHTSARVELILYDLRGRIIRHLIEPQRMSPGRSFHVWDGTDDDGRAIHPGVYFARLIVNGAFFDQRIPLIR